jgi:spore coat protein JB
MNGNSNHNDLMRNLQTISFAMDDARLFLDTHPYELEALNYFEDCMSKRNQALTDYEKVYGPVVSYNVNDGNHWTWVNNPWPWEGEV